MAMPTVERESVDLKDNKKEYVKKMHRQLREAETVVAELEDVIKDRNADENTDVERILSQVEKKLDDVHQRFGSLKNESDETWADQSHVVSAAYRELDGMIIALRSKVKRK